MTTKDEAMSQQDEQEPVLQLKHIHPLDVPLEVFLADLSTRAAKVIRAEMQGFDSYGGTGTFDIDPPYTVRHLCMFSKSEMKRWPNFGKKCLNEVCEMLRERGLQLWDEHDERSLRLLREHTMYYKQYEDQITRLQDACCIALTQQDEQEPFGYFNNPHLEGWEPCAETDEGAIALYEHPASSQPLTDDQIYQALGGVLGVTGYERDFVRLIEKAHGIGGDK